MLDWFNVYCLLHHFSVFTELRELAFLDETLQGFPATINLEIISIY